MTLLFWKNIWLVHVLFAQNEEIFSDFSDLISFTFLNDVFKGRMRQCTLMWVCDVTEPSKSETAPSRETVHSGRLHYLSVPLQLVNAQHMHVSEELTSQSGPAAEHSNQRKRSKLQHQTGCCNVQGVMTNRLSQYSPITLHEKPGNTSCFGWRQKRRAHHMLQPAAPPVKLPSAGALAREDVGR